MGQWHFQGQVIDDLACVFVGWKIDRLNEERALTVTAEAQHNKESSVPLYKAFDPLWLQLDWDRVPKESVQEILDILESRDHRPMLKYRSLFTEVEHPETMKDDHIRFYHHVSLIEYWEDADGQPLSACTLHERVAGGPVLLMGDIESVLKVGPAPMKNKRTWTQSHSDLLAHFIQVVGQVQRSKWSKAPCSISSRGDERHGEFPSLEEFVYAAVYFRQLYSDKLLRESFNCYERFADSPLKVLWVREEVRGFESSLAATAQFVRGISRRALVDSFLYGAGLFHSISHGNPKTARNVQQFWGLIRKEDPLKLAFELNVSFRQLLGYASHVGIVIQHDYGRWLNTEGIPKPNVYWHSNLFIPRPEAKPS